MNKIIKFVDGGQLLSIKSDGLEPSEADSVRPEDVSGVLMYGDQPLYRIGKSLLPVLGCVRREGQFLPIIDIRMIDEKPIKAEQGAEA